MCQYEQANEWYEKALAINQESGISLHKKEVNAQQNTKIQQLNTRNGQIQTRNHQSGIVIGIRLYRYYLLISLILMT